jgi:hypothetical protein
LLTVVEVLVTGFVTVCPIVELPDGGGGGGGGDCPQASPTAKNTINASQTPTPDFKLGRWTS